MAEIRPPFVADLDSGIRKTYLNTIFATGDALANCFAVQLYNGNTAYTIPSGATVKGYFVRQKDNATIELSGTKSGNVASVTLNSACYNMNGPFTLTIKVLEGSAVTTVFYGEGSMSVSRTDYTVNPRFETVEYTKYPVNLMDNSNFANPVNQRGLTEYSGSSQYTIDRWLIANSYTSVTVNDGYITVSAAGGLGWYRSVYAGMSRLVGKTLTIACKLTDGTITFTTGTVDASTPITVSSGKGMHLRIEPIGSDGLMRVHIVVLDGYSFDIEWIALYEGAYTADTLPPYHPKPYSVELAECQRYYVRLNAAGELGFAGYAQSATVARITIPLPNAMRIESPTLTVTYRTNVSIYPGSIMPTAINSTAKCVGHVAAIIMTCSGLTASEPIVMKPNAIIELSADL